MFTLFFFALLASTLCWVFTPFVRDLFGFLGLVDRPDFKRKLHVRAVPRVGGLALAAAYLIALAAALLGLRHLDPLGGTLYVHNPSLRLITRLLPALAVILITG